MMRICAMMFAAVFSVQPLPQADGPLEPSIQNEVDHAIDRGERWLEKDFKKAACDADAINGVPPVHAGTARGAQLVSTAKPVAKDLKAQLGLTNGQSRMEVALKLISTQKGGGWWLTETNAAPTRLAIDILKGL